MSEQDSSFYRTMTLVISGLILLFIIIVIAAQWVVSSRDEDSASSDPRIQAKVAELIKPVGQVNTGEGAMVASAQAPAAAAAGPVDGKATYMASCFACHGTGAAGAPKLGDKAAWSARIALGVDALYKSALTGKNAMPPKGGNMSLSDEAVKAVVDYMIGESK